ncbi:MAG: CBS domain-containing protein [Phycisphaeraceae bacterium]|nr:CBS domain-containing protein [Phycisphaeraceae bacterium]
MSLRPQRQGTSLDAFRDPLNNFDPPPYLDEMERLLAEDTVQAMVSTPIRTVGPNTEVDDVLRIMVENDIACVLVTRGNRLEGIFSERDVLVKVAERYDQVKTDPISRFMTANPACVHETDSPAKAINIMAVGGFRHVPILDADDRVVGLLGPRRVTRYLQDVIRRAAQS